MSNLAAWWSALNRLMLAQIVLGAGLAARAGGPADVVRAGEYANHAENVWIKRSPRQGAPSPHFGWEGSAAYDPYARKWIHWGGHDSIPQGFALFLWDPLTAGWEQKFPSTSPAGVCCVDGANVFDLANRRFVRFPGASLNHGWQWSRTVHLKATAVWLYDPAANAWTNMRPPPYAETEKYSKQVLGSLDACGAYDEKHGVALSFGGQSTAGGMNNLFVYDAYANDLQRIEASSPPSPRDGAGFCYDSMNDCAVLFGSQYSEDGKTYIYRCNTNKWEAHDLTPRPPTRKEGPYSTIPKMAFDSTNGICLCLVWLSEKAHETWALDIAKLQWTKLSPATEPEPSKSRTRNLCYDRGLNVFFLETWTVGSEPQIWTYRVKKAPADLPPEPPADLTCLTAETGKATLRWPASPSANVKEYHVYRAEADRPWLAQLTKLATARETQFDDTGLAAGKVDFYAVRAVGADGRESRDSFMARTQPRVCLKPVVSVAVADRIEIAWNAHPAADVAGYNVYRGVATVATNTALAKSWAFNDPAYTEPVVDRVRNITGMQKLNDKPLGVSRFNDTAVDLSKKGAESGDYKYAVYAYVIRAVNTLGTESGPSPYALTIPAEPQNVLLRENGGAAEIKWDAVPGSAGYRVYRYGTPMALVSPELLKETTFTHRAAGERARYTVVAVDPLGQEGEPSSPVWYGWSYKGFYAGEWHQ